MSETELDRTKKLALNIKETIETSTIKEREKILNKLYVKWIVKPDQTNNIFDYLKLALSNFNLNIEHLQIGLFDRAQKVTTFELTYLHLFLTKGVEIEEEKKEEYKEKFNKLFRAVIDAGNAISSSLYLMSSMTLEDIGSEKTTKCEMFRYSEIDYDDVNPCQSLILYLLEQLQRKEYRRYVVEDKGMCYQKIYNDKGHDTHAWKIAMTIKNFILDVTRMELNFKMWQNLTAAKENLKFTTNYLTEVLSPQFEDLSKERNIFSFKNGIYISKIWNEEKEDWVDQWIPYEGPKAKKIGASVVSCKYFNLEFEDCSEYEDWFDIIKKHCPNFIQVMEFQQWPEEVQRWFCIFIGRMLYEVGDRDDWQILPYLLGQAGAGKSTILENIIKLLYEPADVGILSNNGEKKFGLSALAGKKIFIGPEIKGNLSLEQAEFQSMVSGETVLINKKYHTAYSIKFSAPGMLAGNEIPQYTDNAGSIARRIVVFPFNFKVRKEADSKLGHKIQKELSYIIQGSNKGYIDAIDKCGSSGIWTKLPEFFKETQETMAENTNALTHFLKTDLVILGKDQYCREKVFVAAFNDHCKESHFTTSKWTNQFYAGPFSDFGIKLMKNCRRRYPNKQGERSYSGTFILGVDIKEGAGMSKDDGEDDSVIGFADEHKE
jgi:hypothetical protein